MMTKHLLVVGASMTDDNLLRFAYEVAGLREELVAAGAPGGPGSEIGTEIHLADDGAPAHETTSRLEEEAEAARRRRGDRSAGWRELAEALERFGTHP
ncbi:hypothetical protein [Oerskovia enterophila]|uniref:Uncharacterized protein n=1 Tax=Oerskovia enterophila TaxID=43678 RepID=A0ABX2Y1W1_9CELL|nr:hypothetical protein [Oerskovia enterophila]OCI30528.1 hypothetical protein OERS_27790 [Oerskovia enterophila]